MKSDGAHAVATLFPCARAAFTTRVINIEFSKPASATDKVLFDRATAQITRGEYEGARQALNKLINGFPASQYVFNAKLGIIESWYREGGARGLAQAEAECKNLIKFYPNDPETSKAQELLKKIQDARAKQK